MYNINVNGFTPNESEILEPMHQLTRECIQMDSRNKSYFIKYTDDDIIGATLLLMHISTNRMIHQMSTENIKLEEAVEKARENSNLIYNAVKKVTSVDVISHFKESK